MLSKKILAVLLCVVMVLSCAACAKEPAAETPATTAAAANNPEAEVPATEAVPEEVAPADPFGGYDEPITLTTIAFESLAQACPDGVDLLSNPWQDLWKSKGINVEYAAIATDSDDTATKLNMAILTGELPDYFSCSYATYKELLEADMLMDITDVFEQYATDRVKSYMYEDGGTMASNVTVDGRLYGIVQPADYKDKGGVVAIRTDWLRELGLEEPKSMADLWDIAKAFKDNNMGGTCTIGIGSTSDFGQMLPMLYMLNAHGGYTDLWMEKDGELVHSVIQPEMKAALAYINEKYEEGLLDPEYGTKKEPQLFEDAVSGKSGVILCNMTAPFMLDNGITLGQEWGFFPLYDLDGNVAKTQQNLGFSSCVAISKDCKNPEAVIKLFNMFVEYGEGEPETYASSGINNLSYPAIITPTGVNPAIQLQYVEYLETGVEPENPVTNYVGTAAACESYRVDGDVSGRAMWYIFGPGSTQEIINFAVDNGGYIFSAYMGPTTDAMVKHGGNLGTLVNQMITNIIIGAQEVDEFDTFVETWLSAGGAEITAEVNEWYRNK